MVPGQGRVFEQPAVVVGIPAMIEVVELLPHHPRAGHHRLQFPAEFGTGVEETRGPWPQQPFPAGGGKGRDVTRLRPDRQATQTLGAVDYQIDPPLPAEFAEEPQIGSITGGELDMADGDHPGPVGHRPLEFLH